MDQAEKDVGDLNALLAKRDAAQAALGKAELDLSFCSVRAQFDALVVNLHTAIGQFVAPGPVPVFSLVDTRAWYVMANYRETELEHIAPGMEAEVYVLTDPHYHFRGTVQGIGWAVNPEDAPIVPGVPRIERELNWVHIAQRFPVRIRIENPQPPHVFRVGASAVSIIRGWGPDQSRRRRRLRRSCLACARPHRYHSLPARSRRAPRCSTFCVASWRHFRDVRVGHGARRRRLRHGPGALHDTPRAGGAPRACGWSPDSRWRSRARRC